MPTYKKVYKFVLIDIDKYNTTAFYVKYLIYLFLIFFLLRYPINENQVIIVVANDVHLIEKSKADSMILRELFLDMNFIVCLMFKIGAYDEIKNEFYYAYAMQVIFLKHIIKI